MSKPAVKFSLSQLKRYRNSAIVIFALSVLMCELPLLIVVLGLGGVVSADWVTSPLIQIIVYTIGIVALLVLLGLLFNRFRYKVGQ